MVDTRGKYAVADQQADDEGGFLRFLYDGRTGRILGRTCGSWFKITVFYIIYYCCLAGFFVGLLSILLYGLVEEKTPRLTGEHSLLKMNPGLGFRPQPDPATTLITFLAGKNSSYGQYTNNILKLYKKYSKQPSAGAMRAAANCNASAMPDNQPDKVCPFNWDKQLPDCTPASDFGYAKGQPCVILKLNRIFGWMPDPINASLPHPLVECHGENPADSENIGKLEYSPSASEIHPSGAGYGYFSQVYFPYLTQAEYQSPLVAVQFKSLKPNTLVMVECRLRNLRGSQYSKMDKDAMGRFEILMLE